MKFLADSMLGKLARFLRIFGYDTIYANDLVEIFQVDPVPDDFIVEYAEKDQRIIITKDYALFRSNSSNSIFLKGEGIYNYLQQLKNELGIKLKFNLNKARCSICNSELVAITNKESIKNKVLKETYNNYNKFYQCSNRSCQKVYWQGSHIEDIEKKLDKNIDFN